MIRVALIVAVRSYRDALAEAFATDRSFRIVCSGASAECLPARTAEHVDVIVLGVSSADPIEEVRAIVAMAQGVRVVSLGASSAGTIVSLAQAGVSGYIPPDAGLLSFRETIEAVARGELSCPDSAGVALLHHFHCVADVPSSDRPAAFAQITRREADILALIANGSSNKEIARELSIELQTVKNHVHSILRKLAVRRRGEAAALANRSRDFGTPAIPITLRPIDKVGRPNMLRSVEGVGLPARDERPRSYGSAAVASTPVVFGRGVVG